GHSDSARRSAVRFPQLRTKGTVIPVKVESPVYVGQSAWEIARRRGSKRDRAGGRPVGAPESSADTAAREAHGKVDESPGDCRAVQLRVRGGREILDQAGTGHRSIRAPKLGVKGAIIGCEIKETAERPNDRRVGVG